MHQGLSLRTQLALALALTLLLAGALNGFVALGLLQRTATRSARLADQAAAERIASAVSAECTGRDAACAERVAARGDPGREPIAIQARIRAAGEDASAFAATAPLPDGRAVVVTRPGAGVPRASGVSSLFIGYLLANTLIAFLFGLYLLNRAVGRPIDRIAEAADRIGRLELDAGLGEGGPVLGRLGIAFERMARGLRQERDRTAEQIAELRRVNAQLEEARDSLVRSEKLATTGRLAAGVAHEIGNPLGAILGYLELARGRTGPEGREFLDRIDGEVARIDRTIRELLNFSRPTDGGPLIALRLKDAVETAVHLSSAQPRLKRVSFDVQVPGELEILADSHHLSQVLVNVLLNAGDAMKAQGAITIRAAARPGPGAGEERIELTIADSGPGIPAENLGRLFDPFFTTRPPGEGTGLGLAICHRIMETFGGGIAAANSPEGSAVFTLTFRSPRNDRSAHEAKGR